MKKSNFLFPALLTALMLCDPALAAAGTQERRHRHHEH